MNHGQSRLASFIEQCARVVFGFWLSMAVWVWFIVPVWNLPTQTVDSYTITGIFTVISIVKGYIFRRLFNAITVWRHKHEPKE